MPDLAAFLPRQRAPAITLERLLTEPEWFGLTTASPLQRAGCRILDGLPLGDLALDPNVLEALGGADAVASLPLTRCAEFLLLAGIRSGKSLIAAACGVRAALTCDVSKLGPGEVPRVSILSLKKDTARATWAHVSGRVEASPALRELLISSTADAMLIRHPTGRPVELCIVAGSRAAGSLIGRWSAGVIFDEAPRMVGADEGVVNLDDARQSVAGRMLPGAQVLLIGSPWAPFGPVYKLTLEHFGKPSPKLVVIRGTGPAMNPGEWTPDRCAELKAQNPDAYRVDVLTEFMDPEAGLFASPELEACKRGGPLVRDAEDRRYYTAAMDPATRGNAWTLVVIGREHDREGKPFYFVALARQWIGSTSEPLKPRNVLREIAALLVPYRVSTVFSDQYGTDWGRDIASEFNLWIAEDATTDRKRLDMMMTLHAHVTERTIELAPDAVLLRDLGSVRRRVTQNGITIVYPFTSDGRHADYAPALGLAVQHPPRAPDADPLSLGTPERATADAADAKEAARREVEQRNAKRSRRILGRFS